MPECAAIGVLNLSNKNLGIGVLLDFYGNLLTDKQALSLDLYYNQDLSLSEIAENMDVTRQGARDNIKRGEKQLAEFEEKLHLSEKFGEITAVCEMIKTSALTRKKESISEKEEKYIDEILFGIDKIENII